MPKPPDCSNCNKPATIHLTQIIDNQIKKLDFCEDCPHHKGMSDSGGFSLAELLSGNSIEKADMLSAGGRQVCQKCGYTSIDFKKMGRFGCGQCYTDLESFIAPLLEGMHKGYKHKGKVPQQMLERLDAGREIEELRGRLEQAIKAERFEDAARFRDELKQISATSSSKTE